MRDLIMHGFPNSGLTAMKSIRTALAIIACTGTMGLLTGCQSTVGGQTLPSAFYLDDDVQYFPAGPETQLPELRRRLEEYKLQQSGDGADVGEAQVF